MSAEPSISDIRDSLQRHAQTFDSLLRLIPPKFYLPEINEETINARYQKNKKGTEAKKKDAQRKARAAAKAARLDPENRKTVQDMQAEKLEKQEAVATSSKAAQKKLSQAANSVAKQTAAVDDNAMDVEDDATDMAKMSFDLDDNHAPMDVEAEQDKVVRPMAEAGSISELRERLQARIQTLRQKRKAPEDDVSREALLEKRMKRRKNTKEAQAKAKKAGTTPALEQVLGSKTPNLVKGSANGDANGSGAQEVKSSIFFGKLTTGAIMKKKSVHVKQQLAKVENKKREMDELRKVDSAKADLLEEKDKWGKALDLAKGEKVKDDPKLLRKTVRRDEQQKKKSSREWHDRKETVATKIKERAQKREINIKTRIDAKKMKKQGKSKKAIKNIQSSSSKTGGASKKGSSSAGAKARPGFEGRSGKPSRGGKGGGRGGKK
ncbi:hypothetical protein IWW38_001688 [Coemansia aciculifera]|uniref:Uncharacterized protein n=1 Tax=Coemansia aciculifera TaxID=417176 RepID=A0ACC1M5L9_9FUNG|nr:hypothetical protein IWW38_001688 [Coemansia aciculifera]